MTPTTVCQLQPIFGRMLYWCSRKISLPRPRPARRQNVSATCAAEPTNEPTPFLESVYLLLGVPLLLVRSSPARLHQTSARVVASSTNDVTLAGFEKERVNRQTRALSSNPPGSDQESHGPRGSAGGSTGLTGRRALEESTTTDSSVHDSGSRATLPLTQRNQAHFNPLLDKVNGVKLERLRAQD